MNELSTVIKSILENYTIPPGVTVLIPIFNSQRNPKYWGEDAALFNPDRFLPENFAKINSYSYIPFGGGKQNLFLKICLIH